MSIIGIYAMIAVLLWWRDREALSSGKIKPLTHAEAAMETTKEENRVLTMSWTEQFRYQAITTFPFRHRWLAMFYHRRDETTSSVERLACLLSLVLGSMADDASFYGQGDADISLGATSIVSAFMLLPVRLIYWVCFLRTQNSSDYHSEKYQHQYVAPQHQPQEVPADPERGTSQNGGSCKPRVAAETPPLQLPFARVCTCIGVEYRLHFCCPCLRASV
jgi:hypothetical protein